MRRDFNDRFDDTSTYRLTAAYLWPDLGGRLHASYGTAVKNPTLTELFGFSGDFQGNPGLQPEESRGFDIGWEQAFLDRRVKMDVTAFDNRIDNIIVGAGRTVINLPGESRARGVELSASADLTPDLSGTLAYTFTDTEDTDGQELRRRPRHAASLGLNYRVNDRANLNLTVRHNGSFSDTAFDPETFVTYPVKLDGYTLVNLAAGGGMRDAVRFGHPSGTLRVGASVAQVDGQWAVTRAVMSRSARVLMDGWVRVPQG